MTKTPVSGLVRTALFAALASAFSLSAQAAEALRVAADPVPHAESCNSYKSWTLH